MDNGFHHTTYSLGDSALVVEFGAVISEAVNKEVLARTKQLNSHLGKGYEVVPAYSSLTIHYDPILIRRDANSDKTAYAILEKRIHDILDTPLNNDGDDKPAQFTIPVCYEQEFAPDLDRLSGWSGLRAEEIIELHQSVTYRVYMLGFLPGFCYLGEVDERIAIPRKARPEGVPAGSVGIAGRQTGIYPIASPGGWHIIGRTPASLFRPAESDPVLLKPGDRVTFESISSAAFIEFNHADSRHQTNHND